MSLKNRCCHSRAWTALGYSDARVSKGVPRASIVFLRKLGPGSEASISGTSERSLATACVLLGCLELGSGCGFWFQAQCVRCIGGLRQLWGLVVMRRFSKSMKIVKPAWEDSAADVQDRGRRESMRDQLSTFERRKVGCCSQPERCAAVPCSTLHMFIKHWRLSACSRPH